MILVVVAVIVYAPVSLLLYINVIAVVTDVMVLGVVFNGCYVHYGCYL